MKAALALLGGREIRAGMDEAPPATDQAESLSEWSSRVATAYERGLITPGDPRG